MSELACFCWVEVDGAFMGSVLKKKRSGDARPAAHACHICTSRTPPTPAHAAKPSITCSADMSGELHAKYEDGVRCRKGEFVTCAGKGSCSGRSVAHA